MKKEDFEIKNNEFLRQFEATVGNQLLKLEYSDQERKIFLSKLDVPEDLQDKFQDVFLTKIFDHLKEKGRIKVVPTSKEVKKFFRAHKVIYADLIPIGISI